MLGQDATTRLDRKAKSTWQLGNAVAAAVFSNAFLNAFLFFRRLVPIPVTIYQSCFAFFFLFFYLFWVVMAHSGFVNCVAQVHRERKKASWLHTATIKFQGLTPHLLSCRPNCMGRNLIAEFRSASRSLHGQLGGKLPFGPLELFGVSRRLTKARAKSASNLITSRHSQPSQ